MNVNTYMTSQVANMFGIHPNTVRLYEEWGVIPKAKRKSNGYRVSTEVHIQQLHLVRMALQIEILQNGLRKQVIEVVKQSANGQFDEAFIHAQDYLSHIRREQKNAKEAIIIAKEIWKGSPETDEIQLKRKEVSDLLDVSMDTLRNWEMNGLLKIKRKTNGYRVYTSEDVRRLKVIRSLRCANYSLEAILHMLNEAEVNPQVNIAKALNVSRENSDIISVCDRLIESLQKAEVNAIRIITMLESMKVKFSKPPL